MRFFGAGVQFKKSSKEVPLKISKKGSDAPAPARARARVVSSARRRVVSGLPVVSMAWDGVRELAEACLGAGVNEAMVVLVIKKKGKITKDENREQVESGWV